MSTTEKLANSRKLLFSQLQSAHMLARKGFRLAEDKGFDAGGGSLSPDEVRELKKLLGVAENIRQNLMRLEVLESVAA